MLVNFDVAAAVNVTVDKAVVAVPITTFGVQVKLLVLSANDCTPVSLNSVTRQAPFALPKNL
jgi:hypothetical protein